MEQEEIKKINENKIVVLTPQPPLEEILDKEVLLATKADRLAYIAEETQKVNDEVAEIDAKLEKFN